MEWFLNNIGDIMSLVFGGSLISIVTWRFARRRAEAEAKKAEAEAKQAEAEAKQKEAEAQEAKQDYYQQMMEDLAKDRDYYKQERDEYRKTIKQYDERMDELERKVARNGRMVESLRPFMCADLSCKLRKRVVISESGEVEEAKSRKKKEKPITPYGGEALNEGINEGINNK